MEKMINFTQEQAAEVENLKKEVSTVEKVYTLPYHVTSEIKPRAKCAFMEQCRAAMSEKDIFPLVKSFIRKVVPDLSTDARKALKCGDMLHKVALALYSVGLGCYHAAHADNFMEFLSNYAAFKAEMFIKLHDLGASGDIIETAVHCIASRQWWRVKIKNLHVSAIGKIDVTINGKCWEVGTNGKTFAESTENDYMFGKYTGVIFGVFNDEEYTEICDLFINGKTLEALTYIAQRLYVWEDKYQFQQFMQSIGRNGYFVWKKSLKAAQVVYNGSMYNMFKKNVKTLTLYQYMKNLSDNELLL